VIYPCIRRSIFPPPRGPALTPPCRGPGLIPSPGPA
jgi:hypothetical protein